MAAFKKKIYGNAAWMMSEKIISIFGLFFVTSFVAKYVGPNVFGQIALGMAIFQVVQVVAQMGGDNIIFKRISENEISGVNLMLSSTLLRFMLYIIISLPVIIYFYFFVGGDAFYYTLAISASCLISAIDVLTIYNNATLKSKFNTIANVVGLIVGLSSRYLIAYLEIDPLFLILPIILTTLIPLCIRVYFFKVNFVKKVDTQKISFRYDSVVRKYSKYMLLAGSGVVVSSISVAIYGRMNQFILSGIEGNATLGIYSVSLTLATSWLFVSQALITSFYTSIYSEKNELNAIYKTADLNRLIFFISLFFIIGMAVFGKFILEYLYGVEYISGYEPMLILSLSAILSALGTVSYRFIIKFSGYSYLSKKMLIMCILSFPLSYVFIGLFGMNGAAWCSVLIELMSLTVMNYIFKKGIVLKLHKISFIKGLDIK